MPYTVNGIGTTYFGAWNRQVQDGVCESCHQRVKLVNYETWHCICFLFIPIIPLGKKQILDYCPSCTKHRVLPFRDWVKLRDEVIDETATQLSESPDDPDKAIEMHSALAAFQQQGDAIQLAELMEAKFPDVARVQFYLAAWYERTGKPAVANRLFLRAYELEPGDIHIRRAALLTFVEEGNVDQAKTMTQPFLPGTEQFEPAIFYALATGFQKQGRHQEAAQTLRMLLDAAPGLKSDPTFRKTLVISEKALGVEELTIPPDPFYKSAGFKWTMAAAAIVAALGLWNSYIASNRSVTVVNGLQVPITVSIDGRPAVPVAGNSQTDVTLSEGRHEVEVTEPANQYPKYAFEVATNWWERFTRKPAFVVDPTKSAALLWEEATYVAQKPGAQPPEPRHELRLGEPFTVHKHIDYRFKELPETLRVKRSAKVVKTRLAVLREDVADLIHHGQALGTPPAQMLPFLQTHLQQAPDRDDLLQLHMLWSLQSNKSPECRDFLETRLADRPVRIGWHRFYQTACTQGMSPEDARQRHNELVQKYDTLLQDEPGDASLQYLRGRLEGHGRQSAPYYERALAINPQHPYALYASSHGHLVKGEFDTALELLTKAIEALPNEPMFNYNLTRTRFAAGELAALEASAREELTRTPLSPTAMQTLLKTLVATDRSDEADRELAGFSARYQQIIPGRFHGLLEPLRLTLASIKGDFESVKRETANSADPTARKFAFIARLESGELADPDPAETLPGQVAYSHLCRELVARKLGNAEQAAASRQAALGMLDKGFDDDWVVADILRQASTAKWEEIEDLSCEPAHKAVALVVLAHDRDDLRPKLLDLAERLNFDLEFPHYLLKREIDSLR